MRLSLIVCTYRRPREVQRLLASVRGQIRRPDETLIVDGSPDQETERVVEAVRTGEAIAGLRYVRVPPEHRGLTRQRNYGIDHASGDIVAFLDDDTVPEVAYFEEVLACFERHPDAAGVGGYITNEVAWQPRTAAGNDAPSIFRYGAWERREDYRWRLRRVLGLASPLAPGWIPPMGHGRPIGSLPPDGGDHEVEFMMGCAMAWRRKLLESQRFSSFFEGYGLYEDLDFCVRAAGEGPLYVCGRARLAHYHAPSGRPNQFRYGEMVVRNGWFVWRRRWPHPSLRDRVQWWATTGLLALCRLGDAVRGPRRLHALTEAMGRMRGAVTFLFKTPDEARE